jgi:hypothetical protein
VSDGAVLGSSLIGFVIAAYVLTWIVFSSYAIYVGSRARRAAAALEAERERGGYRT